MPARNSTAAIPSGREGTNVSELRRAALAAGFHEVETAAGWLPLADWKPYGETGTLAAVTMRVDTEHSCIREHPTLDGDLPLVLGRWPLRRQNGGSEMSSGRPSTAAKVEPEHGLKRSGTVPMRVHKGVVIAFLRQYPDEFQRIAPEYTGTVEQYITALESLPGQWFVGGRLEADPSEVQEMELES